MSTVLAGELGEGKIQGWHRDELAVIYVRQLSRQQVIAHGESTRLQYGLASAYHEDGTTPRTRSSRPSCAAPEGSYAQLARN